MSTSSRLVEAPRRTAGSRAPLFIPVPWGASPLRRDQELFRSSLLTIADTACTAERRTCELECDTESHRLVFTRAGAALFRPAGASAPSVLADPTQVLLLPAGETYQVRHSSREPHECTTFAFATTMLPVCDTPLLHDDGASPKERSPIGPELLLRYHRLRRTLLQMSATAAHPGLEVEDEALALLHGTFAAADANARVRHHLTRAEKPARFGDSGDASELTGAARKRQRRRELTESAKMLLASAPGSPHSIEHLAVMLGVSPSHLSHVFCAEVGVSLHQYLLQIRMATALDQLSDGARDLSRLAMDLGFATHSHFSAAFRHWFGMPPSSARKLFGLRRSRRSRCARISGGPSAASTARLSVVE